MNITVTDFSALLEATVNIVVGSAFSHVRLIFLLEGHKSGRMFQEGLAIFICHFFKFCLYASRLKHKS